MNRSGLRRARIAASAHRRRSSFEVVVIGGVSAGKSTLLNAFIGKELLHAANQATTSCLTRVEHDRGRRHFVASASGHAGELLACEHPATADTMQRWNADPAVHAISAVGAFQGLAKQASGLVFIDTPGPNNSLDDGHGQATHEVLRTGSAQLLVHVLDAGHLGTYDDRRFLDMIQAHARPGRSVCFIVNKVDLLDLGRGESLAAHLQQAHDFLEAAGFLTPTIVPTAAATALYARKALHGEPLTRAQALRLQHALAAGPGDDIACALNLPADVRAGTREDIQSLRRAVQARSSASPAAARDALRLLVAQSGILMAELLIQHRRKLP
jgi:GTP-binding protein EngB required for normal cell division